LGFRGTRIPVASVFENLEDGMTMEDIVEMFDGLPVEQVKAVLDFAAHSLRVPAHPGRTARDTELPLKSPCIRARL
jgi:uncharacterized protein (DUF433 family)